MRPGYAMVMMMVNVKSYNLERFLLDSYWF